MSNIFLSSVLIISSILLLNLSIYGLKRRNVPGAFVFSLLMLAAAMHSVGYAFELLSVNLDDMYFWLRIQYIGISFYPLLLVMLMREYTDEKKIANNYVLLFLLTISVFTLVLVSTNSFHSIYYSSVSINTYLYFNTLELAKGIWYHVHMSVVGFSIIYSILVLSRKFKKSVGTYKTKVLLMFCGSIIPFVAFFIYILRIGPDHIDIIPFSYLPFSIFVFLGMFWNSSFFLNPVTHETIINSIEEAVIVVDSDNFLISFNEASKGYFNSLMDIKLGEPITSIIELKGYDFNSKSGIHHIEDNIFSYKVIELDNHKGVIYVISDITDSEKIKKQLEIYATQDAMTGLNNRRHFMDIFKKTESEGMFIIMDIDYFKKINDAFGHNVGDDVISYFGDELNKYFSEHIICRYGGEEFALFIENVDIDNAFILVDSFRKIIEAEATPIKFTFSAGLAKYDKNTIDKAISTADQKLYNAKDSGRNQVKY